MDIEEIRAAKIAAQKQILEIIQLFEHMSTLHVHGIKASYTEKETPLKSDGVVTTVLCTKHIADIELECKLQDVV